VGDAFDAVLRGGETWRPPRAVEVRTALRTRVVSVRRADGAPAPGARVAWRPSAHRHAWEEALADAQGRAALLVADGPIDVFALDAPAGADVTGVAYAAGVSADADVTVRERAPAEVVVKLDLSPGADTTIAWSVALCWIGPPGSRFDEATSLRGTPAPGTSWSPVSPGGSATVRVLEPGVYSVAVQASARGLGGGFQRNLHDGPPTLVEVPPGATGPVRATHRPHPDDVSEVLADAAEL
jgi:hypothetical protein